MEGMKSDIDTPNMRMGPLIFPLEKHAPTFTAISVITTAYAGIVASGGKRQTPRAPLSERKEAVSANPQQRGMRAGNVTLVKAHTMHTSELETDVYKKRRDAQGAPTKNE